ncbi:hypothetical protein [Vibrio agarivorans]|uniref:Uncharacterized protein n=1 Tax=Vibrio agarivorans TaxID=153622 RepID=A0ABT7Y750_9VIBR|nr:hypothetical protein [Vibrio agarivorans]MDN2483813.1 hypothetical protein [Vibrio agarivorans]
MNISRYSLFKLCNVIGYWHILLVTLENGDSIVVEQHGKGEANITKDFAVGGKINAAVYRFSNHGEGLTFIQPMITNRTLSDHRLSLREWSKPNDDYMKRVIGSWVYHADNLLSAFAKSVLFDEGADLTQEIRKAKDEELNKLSSEQSEVRNFITMLLT